MSIAPVIRRPKDTLLLLLSIVLSLVLASCDQQRVEVHVKRTAFVDSNVRDASITQQILIPTSADTSVRIIARILAGLDTLRGMEWYARAIRTSITRHDSVHMSRVRQWSERELQKQSQADVIFYPFSGPDALYMLGLFPNAKQYVMIASEPAGTFPRFNRLRRDSVKHYLESVIESTREIYAYSYFITDSMRKNLKDSIVSGTLPLISMFLAQHGYDVLGYDRAIDTASDSTRQTLVRHVLYFRRDERSPMQQLTYIEANLGNYRYMGLTPLPQNSVLQEYLNSLPQCHTFIKSASYLMHSGVFSTIREFVLNKSLSILQDDTGVPYRHFGRGWQFRFYGTYERPIRQFTGMYQADLDSMFTLHAGRHGAVPFPYGYLRLRKSHNVYLATRLR